MARKSPGPAALSRPCRIVMMAALPQEVRPFLRHRQAQRRRGRGFPAWEFVEGEGRVVVAISGMGPGAARRTAAALLARCTPEVFISLGFGGALTPDLPPGALVLGESFWGFDLDTQELTAIAAPPPPRPLPALVHYCEGAGLPVHRGTLVTTNRVMDKGREGGALGTLGSAVVLDLETAPLAQLAAARGLSFLSLRAITDVAAEEIPAFIRPAGETEPHLSLRQPLRWLAQDPRRLRPLLHLWRRSRRAADVLTRALLVLLPFLAAAGDELQGQPT